MVLAKCQVRTDAVPTPPVAHWTGITHPGVKVNARKLTTYNKAHNFNLNGKIGVKLKTLLDVELEGVDTVSIEANLGDITKEELDQPALMSALQSK